MQRGLKSWLSVNAALSGSKVCTLPIIPSLVMARKWPMDRCHQDGDEGRMAERGGRIEWGARRS